ncbi:MAG: redoxin domain-containing protein [Paludibacter sp.]
MKSNNLHIKPELSVYILKLTIELTVLCMFGACQVDDNDLSGVVGSKAPYFLLTTSEGNQINLFDYKNKTVVLFFFGNESESSKVAAKDIQKMLVQSYTSRDDIVFLGLDHWNGDMALVRSFKSSTGVTFPLLLDAGNTATNYKTTYDRLVIIDKNGNVVFSGTQNALDDITNVKQKVDILLAK